PHSDLPIPQSTPLSLIGLEGPAANIKRSLTRSSKPAQLKLQKSNGSTAESIRSISSSTTPPPPPPKPHRTNEEPSLRTPNSSTPSLPPPPPPKSPSHRRSNSVSPTHNAHRKQVKRSEERRVGKERRARWAPMK